MSPDPPSMPTGTVTFLLTDVEGSTRAWSADPDGTAAAIIRHYQLLEEAIATHGGYRPVDQGEGDSIVGAFARPSAAVAAAVDAQRALVAELSERFTVRMALHTGEAMDHDGGYFGATIIRTARLRSCAHGGQILVSRATAEMVADGLVDEVSLISLGRYRLRDLDRPEEIWQVVAPGLRPAFPPPASPEGPATNLPVALTPLIGRVDELAAIALLLRDEERRVVTLTGPGGVGKTRLAQHSALDAVDAFADGVWWVELAPIDRGHRVAEAIAMALGIPESTAVPAQDQLIRTLADKRALLVLDNCEHVIDASTVVVERLARACPSLTVLATSREPFGTTAETIWRVPSLTTPSDEVASVADLSTSDAARLFVARAQRARAGFQLTDENAGVVAAICRRLDGIPLALELAAARARVAPLERLATELNERFRVLTGGDRGALARHQTLLASVDWSHDLLSDKERKLFRRLCVFVATFGGDAVAAVVTDDELDEYEALDLLGRLVDKSLVQLDDTTGRYHLLETMRQLALDRCRAADELDQLRDRHMRWVLGFLEGVDHDLCDRPTIAAMDTDYLNIRAALSWAADRDNDAAVRMVDTLGGYWGLSGRHRDTFLFSKPILDGARDRDPVRWATAVSMVAWVFVSAGDTEFVTNDVLAALELARTEGDVASQARCLYGIGLASPGQSEMFEPVHALATEAGNQRYAVYGALLATGSLIGTAAGDPAFERAARVAVGFDDETFELAYPGWLAQHVAWRGHPTQAVALAREALQHESRAIAAQFTVAAAAMSIALQVADAGLLRLAAESIPSELRQIPGAEWWVQLLDDGAQLLDPDRVPSAIDPPPVLMLFLLASDLVLRLLLTDGRLDDADSWAAQVPPTWPAAHGSARLAQAWAALQRGDRAAGDRIHEALAEAVDLDIRPFVAEALELVALHLGGGGHHEQAARLLGAAETARAEAGSTWRYPYQEQAVRNARKRIGDALGESGFEDAVSDGARATVADAVDLARRMRGRRRRVTHGWDALTPTELNVARAVAAGHTNTQVAERLYVAPSTVKTHLERIYAKLGISGRAALATELTRQESSRG